MTKHEKLFKALSDVFDITPLNEQMDDFETTLQENGLEIANSIPTNWLDPLFEILGNPPYYCPDIEKLLLALKAK